MSETVISGLNFEQYAKYFAEAGALRQKWEMSGGSADIQAEMLQVLAKYNQDPATCMDEDGLNYHACGMILQWQDVINSDPQLLVKFSQVQSAQVQQSMFGDAGESASLAVEGISLEKYAETAAKLQNAPESEHGDAVASMGYADMDHYQRVSDGFTAAMEKDMKIASHFGQLFAQYGTGHMANMQQLSEDLVARHLQDVEDSDDLEEQAIAEVMKRAASGQATTVVDYLKQTFPDDADDNDALDWYLDKACDQFGEAGNRGAALALLEVRFTLQEDEDDKDDWINSAMELLFD